MTPPLTIPLSASDRPVLAALVARLWPAEATQAGVVDVAMTRCCIEPDGYLIGVETHMRSPGGALERAADGLADALADHYLVIDGRRMVGWAATENGYRFGADAGNLGLLTKCVGPVLVRILDLDARDARRLAYDDAVREARAARRAAAMGPVAADAKRAGALARDRAAYPRRAGR